MANILSLALKVTGDTTGLKLDPVQRALVSLGDQTEKITGQFAKFAGDSAAAGAAQERFAAQAQGLINTLRDGGSATEFAAGLDRLAAAADKEAAAFARAAQITDQNRTALERFDLAQAELQEQVDAGRISQETYNRAVENAAKGLTTAEREARGLATTTETIDDAAGKTTLQFNELAGIFAVLPGPLGNIAGRFSGIASAAEGLGRIFSGGLSQGISGVVGSFTALVNPLTVALAGVAAFAAGATSIVSGLTELDDRVEKLGNTADKLGTSFEFVQVLDEAARRSGTSIDTVSAAFGRLQVSVTGVDEESKKAQAGLASIGVTADELRQLNPQEQYQLIAERLAEIEDPALRTATAVQLFGKSGAELLPFFNNIAPAASDLERFGATISAIDRGRVDALGGSFDALFLSLRGLGQNLLLPFAGLVEGATNALANFIGVITKQFAEPFGKLITPLLDSVGSAFSQFSRSLADNAGTLGQSLQGIADIFRTIFDTIVNVVEAAAPGIQSAFDSVTSTVSELGRIFADSFGAIFEALGDFGSSVAELLGYGNDISAIGTDIGAAFGEVYRIAGQVVGVIGDVIGVLNRLFTIIAVSVIQGAQQLAELIGAFLQFTGLSSALQAIGGVISSVFGSVASVFGTIASAIGGTVGRLLEIAESFLGIERTTEQATAATEQLAASADQAAESAAVLSDEQKRAADESSRRAEEAKKIAEEETKRVEKLLELQDPVDQLARDITATNNEIVRTEAALAEARAAGAADEVARLSARLAQLDQLQAQLVDQSEEAALGFAEGFGKAFADVDKGIGGLIDKAGEFGNEGAIAASQLTEGIEAAKEAVKDGILNKEAFESEVERQKELYEDRVKGLRDAAKITEQLYEKEAELLAKQFEIEKERAEELAAVRLGSIKIADIRDGGISQLFDTLREDPALGEAKKQTKELQRLREEIAKMNAQKVDILAGTG
jgi:rRNA processing protein Gar1